MTLTGKAAARPAEARAAQRLAQAEFDREPCAPIRDEIGTLDLDAAYAVQALNLAARYSAGRRRVGRKIGLTSPAVQDQLGVGQPDFGSLVDDMAVDGASVSLDRLLQPKIEAEVAFTLSRALDGPLDSVADVRPAVGMICAALEIVDSRIAGWDICITDTIADNASSGLFVLSDLRIPLGDFEPDQVTMTMTRDGEVCSSGRGTDCLGGPLNALLWLGRAAARVGEPLQAGEIVLSGALGPMVPVHAGDEFVAEISGLGQVSARFVSAADHA